MSYKNTMECWQALKESTRDARYNGLVDVNDFTNQRNNKTVVHLNHDESPARWISGGYNEIVVPEWPILELSPPTIQQPHLEIVAEKTTVDDIIIPLGQQYGINVTSCAGQISLTRCNEIVERVKANGGPTRVFYLSDFDPSGQHMPVAAARKIEFLLRDGEFDLDIQLRHVLLISEQYREFSLPRVPVKDSDSGKARFEARYGEGATELDPPEALHPGALKRILESEIDRYYDHDLDDRIEEVAADIEADIDAANEAVRDEYQSRIEELEAEYSVLEERRKALCEEIGRCLRDDAPDIDDIGWPEPADGDHDSDPLFDSKRSDVEQMDRYKRHQGKPTAWKGRAA